MVEFILPNDIDSNLSKDTGKDVIIDNVTVTESLYGSDETFLQPTYRYLFRLSINGVKKVTTLILPINMRMIEELNSTNLYPLIYKELKELIKNEPAGNRDAKEKIDG